MHNEAEQIAETETDWENGLRIMRETIPLLRYRGYTDDQIAQLLGRLSDHRELWSGLEGAQR